VPIVLKTGSLKLLEPSGPVQVCNRIVLPLYVTEIFVKVKVGHVDALSPHLKDYRGEKL
jgi:hypothetical protein